MTQRVFIMAVVIIAALDLRSSVNAQQRASQQQQLRAGASRNVRQDIG